MTDAPANLDELIKELEAKLAELKEEQIKREKLAALKGAVEYATKMATIIPPTPQEQQTIKSYLNGLKANKVMLASMVHEYRRLYAQHKDWFKARGYPDDLRGSQARNFANYGKV